MTNKIPRILRRASYRVVSHRTVDYFHITACFKVFCYLLSEQTLYWIITVCVCVCVLRLKAYIEEEVQKRLQQMNLLNTDNNNGLSLSTESLQVSARSHCYTRDTPCYRSDPDVAL